MQILYQIMQWKPHNCILYMITNFDTKCKAWFLKSSSAQVTLPTEAWGHITQWGAIDNQSEIGGVSTCQLIFAYVQQASSPVEMNNLKDHILTQFMHRNLYEISTSQKQKD